MFLAPSKKAGFPNFLSKDKDSLVVLSAHIEGGHILPLKNHDFSDQLQCVFKYAKFRCGDNNINKISPLKYFRELIKCVNKREIEHEIQTRKSSIGLLKL